MRADSTIGITKRLHCGVLTSEAAVLVVVRVACLGLDFQWRGDALAVGRSVPTRPSPLRTTVSELDTIGYRRFSGALLSQGLGTDSRGPSRSLDPDG